MQVNRSEMSIKIHETKALHFMKFYTILHECTERVSGEGPSNDIDLITAWQQLMVDVPLSSLGVQSAINMKLYQTVDPTLRRLKQSEENWDQFVQILNS